MEHSTWIRTNAHIYFLSLYLPPLSLSCVCWNVYFIICPNVFVIWQVCLLPPSSSSSPFSFDSHIKPNDVDVSLFMPHFFLPSNSSFHPPTLFLCSHLLDESVYIRATKKSNKSGIERKHQSKNALVCGMRLQ